MDVPTTPQPDAPLPVGEPTLPAPATPPVASMVGAAAILALFLVLVGLMVTFEEPTADPADPVRTLKLEKVREEAQNLNGYGWVDKANGVVRVPIDEAERLLVKEGGKLPDPRAKPPVTKPAPNPNGPEPIPPPRPAPAGALTEGHRD